MRRRDIAQPNATIRKEFTLDDTAKTEGPLPLNPLRHIDRVGTILLPGIPAASQLLMLHNVQFLFGGAKPVPVAA